MKFADIFIAFVVVAVVLLIILPLNEGMMDILLTLNLSLSLVILFATLYVKEPLDFAVFPSVLLITTLFRLALNISSTKLILGKGSAGKVIETFGHFVVQGNLVVGAIVFLIIVIVQFIVITKGAERVAEVAARFTLDAMPGKQMAIDADLNSGLIDENEAKRRRQRIQQEADFYGAMDGASKFVKGDAIVGILITIINIVGGIIIGSTQRGMPIEQVLERYTILTIGDGLVSQIPALLISTATGIIVTRAASESNLGRDLLKQITGQPLVLVLASVLLFIMGFFPGFPRWVLFAMGACMAYMGYTLIQASKASLAAAGQEAAPENILEEMRKPENVMQLLEVDPLEVEFGYGLIPLADVNQGGDLLDRIVMIRRQMALDLGLIVPVVRLRDNIQLEPNEYVIKVRGVEVARGQVLPDHLLAMDPGTVEQPIEGIDTVEPAFGLPAKWIKEHQRERAEMLGYTVVDPPSVISTHLTEVIRKHGHELINRQDVQTLLDNLKGKYPALVEDVVPKTLTLGEVQKVLANLIKENVPIRDMVTILETLADYGNITKDPDMLTEYVRQALARTITSRFVPEKKVKVLTLAPELEKAIMDSVQQTEHGSYLAMEPTKTHAIFKNLTKELEKLTSIGLQPIVLTAPVVRMYFKRLTEQVAPDLVVLSYNELDGSVEIQSVGVVRA
ncbi:flagellar biosynthesis protein FlhA [Caldicoprobacter guelmensis]|uniref:flagellar biosynthesis protein FlhA n=1 Tax=Caldicoprobacter guelmensis TaxID=1170224 RepID=UPI00195C4BBF|nr:flagellar biosynthesis protein FlhA [Caldicoprobacter guelmensis]MBM7581398.1 flagellar biosynthesis protein FlhA [Caldicoprobacter guelmensis]